MTVTFQIGWQATPFSSSQMEPNRYTEEDTKWKPKKNQGKTTKKIGGGDRRGFNMEGFNAIELDPIRQKRLV